MAKSATITPNRPRATGTIPNGARFGRWSVVKRAENRPDQSGARAQYLCRCDCGAERVVLAQSLRAGLSGSCGCLQREVATERMLSRGGVSRSPFYNLWRGLVSRCFHSSSDSFKHYGGRGITVCDEWRDNPAAFITWCESLGDIPNGHSIDRIDNDGPYAPWNCRFASVKTQARNKRTSRIVAYKSESICFTELVEKYGVVGLETAKSRLYRFGFSPLDAALMPPSRRLRDDKGRYSKG